MAGLFRLSTLQGLKKGVSLLTKQQNLCRTIGTSSKKNDTKLASSSKSQPVKKYWVTWGFNLEDEKEDRHLTHLTFFVSITLCLVVGGYYVTYMPNTNMTDWAQREAYLELRHREELGLPPIDKDYFDPANFILPTDEELGDTPIII